MEQETLFTGHTPEGQELRVPHWDSSQSSGGRLKNKTMFWGSRLLFPSRLAPVNTTTLRSVAKGKQVFTELLICCKQIGMAAAAFSKL